MNKTIETERLVATLIITNERSVAIKVEVEPRCENVEVAPGGSAELHFFGNEHPPSLEVAVFDDWVHVQELERPYVDEINIKVK